jgi:hypothetical protein
MISKEVSDKLQYMSKTIYRALIEIKFDLDEVEENLEVETMKNLCDEVLCQWRLFDNALFNSRADWHEIGE